MKKSIFFLALFAILISFQSCVEEPALVDNPENLVAPELPPATMYTVPTAALRNTDSDTSATATSLNGVTYHNWIHAGLNVLYWNTVVFVNMVIPTAAFGEAFNHDPVYIGNSTFEWSYTYNAQNGDSYEVILTGQYVNNTQEVDWVMTVSKAGGFQDFVWYTGTVSTDLTTGEFILNRHPANPQTFVSITHTKELSLGNAATRFTNIIPGDNGNGNYLEYRIENNGAFNRALDVQGNGNNLLEIQLNEPGGDGRVRHPQHFGDNEWHCWDTNQIDIDC